MSNGNLMSRVVGWLLAEKQMTTVCSQLKTRNGKAYRKWVPEVLGVNESLTVEVRIRPNGFTEKDFQKNMVKNLDSRVSANYLYYVIPAGLPLDKTPDFAGVLVPTGDARVPFNVVKSAHLLHTDTPTMGLLEEVARKAARELSASMTHAAELERALTNLVEEIYAQDNDQASNV